MKMKQRMKDVVVVGFAMFAIFFGSGNLIFPPYIGLQSGAQIFPAIIGLALSGILFPMLAVASVGNVGNTLEDMMKHVTPWWHRLFMALGILIVCFGTVPRCGGVAFEAGFEGIFGKIPVAGRVAFLFVFFAVAYYFAMNKSNVIDKIGNYLTPVLLITLLIVIVLAIVNPVDSIHGGVMSSPGESFINAFKTGYNTGDIGTGILVAGLFIETFRQKGYREKVETRRMMFGIIATGFILLFIIYAGLAYLGAQGTSIYRLDVDTTFLLTSLVKRLAGYGGLVVLSLAVIFATLTTAIGMIATVGEWIEDWSRGKLPYTKAALMLTVIMFLVSSSGVANVLIISGPLFTLLFPMCVVMTFLGLFRKFVPNDGAWKGAVIVSFVMAFFDALNVAKASGLIRMNLDVMNRFLGMIPFASSGFAWLIPSVAGFVIGAVIYKILGKESLPYAADEKAGECATSAEYRDDTSVEF
ncbi:branched-chain amino acid transport system II carrier protein [Hornefia butyriciproducens]|uniref:Branched-chain amino acid transport system carrier protein n=1 Tax=Hornefia butyriciproducens TaxID=2652293 RepID=A0A6L5Y6L1_9FIRM|nr:branched-chain amino acid transport system II carrier protein [Hornefia butyriciproducens]MST52330.1 hypothetical protein [Hornefia butyriciproducens]